MIKIGLRVYIKGYEKENREILKKIISKVDDILEGTLNFEKNSWSVHMEDKTALTSICVPLRDVTLIDNLFKGLNPLAKENKDISGEVIFYTPETGEVNAIYFTEGTCSRKFDFVNVWDFSQGTLPDEVLYQINHVENSEIEIDENLAERWEDYLIGLVEGNLPLPEQMVTYYPDWLEITDLTNIWSVTFNFDSVSQTV